MTERKHIHKWLLAKYEPRHAITEMRGSGDFGIYLAPTGEYYSSYSVFVCECGAKKEVTHKETK